MTELAQRILEEYQVRKTRKQKDRFIALMKEHYPQLHIHQSGLLKSRNLIVGDISSADVILSAHYDTCARMIIPNFITPKRPLISILYSFLLIIPMGIVVFLFNYLLGLITDNFFIHYILSVLLWLAFMYLMVAGPANQHTVNDNTSGVLLLCEMLEEMTEQQKEKTVIVFFDNEELGLVGSTCFRKQYKKILASKLLINFDCISDGDYLMAAISKNARKRYNSKVSEAFTDAGSKKFVLVNSEKIYYPSDQAGFSQHIAVAALHHNRLLGQYMGKIHTIRDTTLDCENITILCDRVRKLIDML